MDMLGAQKVNITLTINGIDVDFIPDSLVICRDDYEKLTNVMFSMERTSFNLEQLKVWNGSSCKNYIVITEGIAGEEIYRTNQFFREVLMNNSVSFGERSVIDVEFQPRPSY